MRLRIRVGLCALSIIWGYTCAGQIKVAGAMKDVVQKGDLSNHISIDTITPRVGLYGLGPAENMEGELLTFDGITYLSTISPRAKVNVARVVAARAPFFVYKHIDTWRKTGLPDSVKTLRDLEAFLNDPRMSVEAPFAFKITGTVQMAKLHVLATPNSVSSYDSAHSRHAQARFDVRDELVDILGFFSRDHKGVFTHHDSFIHLHLITKDRKIMGHLDDFVINSTQLSLYIEE